MDKVKAKIYYLISTGEVLTITSEMQGSVKETTKEEDVKIFENLKDKNADEIDFIELEYGTFASTLKNAKSYKINLEVKKLDVIYYTQEELEAIEKQGTQALFSRVSDIANYLSEDSSSISDVEDYILQKEQNKILGVM